MHVADISEDKLHLERAANRDPRGVETRTQLSFRRKLLARADPPREDFLPQPAGDPVVGGGLCTHVEPACVPDGSMIQWL